MEKMKGVEEGKAEEQEEEELGKEEEREERNCLFWHGQAKLCSVPESYV